MQKRVLLLCILFLSPSCTVDRAIRKHQIQQGQARAERENKSIYNEIKKKYDSEFAKLEEQYDNEVDKIPSTTEEKMQLAYELILNEYLRSKEKIQDRMMSERIDQTAKKYNLPKEIARFRFMPFSVPLVKDMAIAAYAHDKEKLQRLLSEYFTIIYGNDWRALMTQRKQHKYRGEPYGEMVKAAWFDQDAIGAGVTDALGCLYFKEKSKEGFIQADKLVKELFDL